MNSSSLRVAREVTQRALNELAADRRLALANQKPDAYWVGRLREAAQQMLNATADGGDA